MIKTTLVGLGKIGYYYDKDKPYKKITHFSSLQKNKKFKLVSVVEKKTNLLKKFRNKHNIPAYNNIIQAINNHTSKFLILACKINLELLKTIIKKTKIKFILIEKPFIISPISFLKLKKILDKKKIFFSINFQRNFNKNYIKYFYEIKNGIIGKQLKFYNYYTRDFNSNASHFLNLALLIDSKFLFIKKVDNSCIQVKFKKLECYFFKVANKYNNNSFSIYGSKGKFEVSSRPEIGKLSIKKSDKIYKKVNILGLKKKIKMSEKYPQDTVLKNIYNSINYNKNPLIDLKHILIYLKLIKKIQKFI